MAATRVPNPIRVNFLDKLPAELRNEIYELVFTTEMHQQSENIDLLAAQPPGMCEVVGVARTCPRCHIPLSCRAEFAEALGPACDY